MERVSRLGVIVKVSALFALVYLTTNRFPLREPFLVPQLAFDGWVDFSPAWIWIYFSTYLFAFLPVFVLPERELERAWLPAACAVIAATGLGFLLAPTTLDRSLFPVADGAAAGLSGLALTWFRVLDTPVNCVPSLHIAFSFLAASAMARYWRLPWRALVWPWFGLIAWSTMATKQHFALDVLSGCLVGWGGVFLFRALERKLSEGQVLAAGSAERQVYDFYRYGVPQFGDFHGGYLNFGYWEDGQEDYLKAAERLVHKLAELLRLDSRSRLLDVACGMGGQDIYILRHFEPARIEALDLVPEHLEHGRRRAREARVEDRIGWHHGTALRLPFSDRSFSHLLCIEGLIHFVPRKAFFQECVRVLEPGGRVAFSDYALKKEPRTVFQRSALRLVTWLWHIPYDNALSPEQYRAQLESLGFVDVRVHRVGERVIPGYCREQARPECIRELTRIRGFFAGRIGHVIDWVLERCYRSGLIEYVLVEGAMKS